MSQGKLILSSTQSGQKIESKNVQGFATKAGDKEGDLQTINERCEIQSQTNQTSWRERKFNRDIKKTATEIWPQDFHFDQTEDL